MKTYYQSSIKDIYDERNILRDYITEDFNVLWIKENYKYFEDKLDNFKNEDNVIFEVVNGNLKIYNYILLKDISKKILQIINICNNKEKNIKLPLYLCTEILCFSDIKSFLLLHKLSESSPLKKICTKILNNLKKENIRYKLKVEIINEDLNIVFKLHKVIKKEKRIKRAIINRQNIKKFGDAKNSNIGVTTTLNENIYLESEKNILFKKSLEKQKMKILNDEERKYKIIKKEVTEDEGVISDGLYRPPKGESDSINDGCIIFVSGYPIYSEEDNLRDLINNYLNESTENVSNEYCPPSSRFRKKNKIKKLFYRIKDNNNNFSFITFYNKEDALKIIKGCENRLLSLDGGILNASLKKQKKIK